MKPSLRSPRLLRTGLVLAVALILAAAALPAQSVSTTGVDYSTGKYGAAESTRIWYIPFTGSFDVSSDWTLKLTIPYIRVTGPGNVVRDLGPVGGPPAGTVTNSGLGDIVAGATWHLADDVATGLSYSVTGKLKLGTASRTKDLGTGENDVMFQFDASRAYGAWVPFATAGYRILGDPPGATLRNGFYGSAGATYRVDTATTLGAAVDLRQRSTPNADNAAELSAFLTHRLDSQWRLQGYVVAGLTDASPDFGVGGMVQYSF
jgi:hypothetical protein